MAVDTRKKSKLTRWAVGTLLGAGLCAWAFWPVQTARIFRTGLLPVRMLAARCPQFPKTDAGFQTSQW